MVGQQGFETVSRTIESTGPLEGGIEKTQLFGKLKKRTESGKPLALFFTDVDGTLYTMKNRPEGGHDIIGNNERTSEILLEGNIPLVLVTGRSAWSMSDNKGLEDYNGLTQADVLIGGGGSYILWRNPQTKEFWMDEEYLAKLKEQKIRYRNGNNWIETSYDPKTIAEQLTPQLNTALGDKLRSVKAVYNNSVGVTTVDVAGIPFKQLDDISEQIKGLVQGTKLLISDALADPASISRDQYSGLIHIVPALSGKDRAVRYILDRVCSNPQISNYLKSQQSKVQTYVVGDATIDINMLAMGAGVNDQYEFHQYALENLTPYATYKLKGVSSFMAGDASVKQRESGRRVANLTFLKQGTGSEGVNEVAKKIA